MQPLMAKINQQIEIGSIKGLELRDGHLCHQLFADDTGLLLDATEEEFDDARATIQ